MDRTQIKVYFSSASYKNLALSVLGVAAILSIGAALLFNSIALAAAVAAGGAAVAWSVIYSSSGGMSDKKLDDSIKRDLKRLKKRALDKAEIDIDETVRDGEVIVSPRVFNRGGAELHFRKGADGMMRFTPLHVTVLHFTEHQLVVYSCALDLLTGTPLNEQVVEYFYTHVVAVTVENKALSFKKSELGEDLLKRYPALKDSLEGDTIQLNHAQVFTLKTAAGDIRIVLRDAVLAKSLGADAEFHLDYTHKAVQAVRAMLRPKKTK